MAEPVSLAQAKLHLRVDGDDDDDLISDMIGAAREWVERYTGHTLVARDVAQGFRRFYGLREINAWPVAQGAVAAITYVDAAGEEHSVSARVASALRPARVYPAAGTSWDDLTTDQVVVTVPAGYATPSDVPQSLRAAIRLMIGDLYLNRAAGMMGTAYQPSETIQHLCQPYCLPGIA